MNWGTNSVLSGGPPQVSEPGPLSLTLSCPPPNQGQRAGAAAGVRVGSRLENREQSICCARPARSHGYRPALSAPGPPPGRVCERTAAGWPGCAFLCSFVGQQRLRVPRRWLGHGDKGAVSPGSRHCSLLRQGPPRVLLGTGRGSHGNSPCRQLLQVEGPTSGGPHMPALMSSSTRVQAQV